MSKENHSLLVLMYRLSNSELIQKDGRRKKTAKRLCKTNMIGLYRTDLTSFAVISS